MHKKDDALIAINMLFDGYEKHYEFLMQRGEVSIASDYENQFAKVALLACASYFEVKVTDVILEALVQGGCRLTYHFISKQALARRYHTLFSWDGRNANNFFGLFGDDFKGFVTNKLRDDDELKLSIRNFLELGALRNKLVHDNYATFNLQLTAEDIKSKFDSACLFLVGVRKHVDDFRMQEALIEGV